ncbi:MAG TPA: glycoside hydrolase family 16 protein [Bryobacteraceae bacterium]|nr:glycoside hydrolase family 16 protein [Bryobacteraceae bacterium]
MNKLTAFRRRDVLLGVSGTLLSACNLRNAAVRPSIEFTRIPQADASGREKTEIIEGRVQGGVTGQQIVLYAKNGKWWVQPLADRPLTPVGANSKWTNATHLGTDYAAVLVQPGFVPPLSMDELPAPGGPIAAIAATKGAKSSPSTYLNFSGYEWRVRTVPSSRGGNNLYDAKNAWIDEEGALHLRTYKSSSKWSCAEIALTRSLGYGTYSFVVRDTSRMQPSTVLDMFTYDYSGHDQNYHEMNIEISRWGDPASKNAQYVVQPYYEAANVARFETPSGVHRHSLHWESGRALFRTVAREPKSGRVQPISSREFTMGIPSPGIESIRVSLYAFGHGKVPLNAGDEVVIEKFEYLP